MKRSEVKEFLKAGVDALNLEFGRGRITEFNSDQAVRLPAVWWETSEADSSLTPTQSVLNSWNIILHIAKQDKQDSSADQYEDIIDECDEVAQKLIVQYNQIVDNYNLVKLESFRRTPFIKKHGGKCATGVVLEFTLIDHDTTNYCP